MKRRLLVLAAAAPLAGLLAGGPALAYPLDAAEATGIDRLEAYRLCQKGRER